MSSFGEDLKRERELRQISLREVADATKINIRYLDALERNDFRHLPGGVFNKGFVRAYAEYIGIDPDAMTNAYLLQEREQDERSEAGPRPLTPRRAGALEDDTQAVANPGRRRGLLALLILGAVLLLAALTVLWLRVVQPSFARQVGQSHPSASASRLMEAAYAAGQR